MFTQHETAHIVEGMEVYDSNANLIGEVDTFREGEGPSKTNQTDTDTIIATVSDVLGRHKDMPTIMYLRLYEQGFVRIKRGLFQRDIVVESDQINEVNEVSIHLNATEDELVKI